MRFLLISICFLVVSCGSYSKKQGFNPKMPSTEIIKNPYFSNTDIDYIYKASIHVYNRDFSGLLIIKKINEQEHRVVFTTEMGNKLFDFTFTENHFQVNYILDKLNRKMLINVLKNDFKVLVSDNLQVINTFSEANTNVFETSIYNKNHYYYFENKQLTQVVRTKNGKAKVQFLFSEINNHLADQIDIKHHNIKLDITLQSITQ